MLPAPLRQQGWEVGGGSGPGDREVPPRSCPNSTRLGSLVPNSEEEAW